MPVTILPNPSKVGRNADPTVQTGEELLKISSKMWVADLKPEQLGSFGVRTNKKIGVEDRSILRSSFTDAGATETLIPYNNGFVHGILRAFNQDLHLVLKPDDVWIAILCQFSRYVNAHAEELRGLFVDHEGQKKLVVDLRPAGLSQADIEQMADAFSAKIHESILDEELQRWMLPSFSTSTPLDRAVGSMIMMGAMQHYFEYVVLIGCGFPSVTLLGEREDWFDLIARAQRLPRYGPEAADWSRILIPVLWRMVQSFDEPSSDATIEFWNRVGHEAGQDGSGFMGTTLSGWITVFCFWDEKGERVRDIAGDVMSLDAMGRSGVTFEQRKPLVLDGVQYPMIRPGAVTNSIVTVPVIIEEHAMQKVINTTLVCGTVAMQVSDDGSAVRPKCGWWMLGDSEEKM